MVKLDEDDDDLQFLDMDEPKPRNTYDANQGNYTSYEDISDIKPRNTCPESGLNHLRIQGLEEVVEMSEESDITSQLSMYDREYIEKTSSSSDSSSE